MSLRVDQVSAEYRPNGAPGKRVLEGVSLHLAPGEVVGVIGPNGAGKSTLLRLLTRRLEPSAGSITLAGRALADFGRFELARHLALVAQSPVLPVGFRVAEVVSMGRAPHVGLFGVTSQADRAAVAAALEATDTARFGARPVETLSGGEQQRVVFARALAQQPRYLLLDEPTNHLDLRYQVELLGYARAQARAGVGVLVVLHDLNLAARTCDRLLVLDGGRLVAEGAPSAVLTADLIGSVFGARVRVLDDAGTPVVVPEFGLADAGLQSLESASSGDGQSPTLLEP